MKRFGSLFYPGFALRVSLLLLLGGLSCWFWRVGVDGYRTLSAYPSTATLRCDSAPIPASFYEDMKEAEGRASSPLAFSLWDQQSRQTVEDKASGRQVQVAALTVLGSTRLTLPVSPVLGEQDVEGCLIDAGTALKLFGGASAQGAVLLWQEREYTVRDVFPAPNGTMVVRPASAQQALPNITLENGAYWEEFSFRHSLSPSLTVRQEPFVHMAGLLCRLPPAAVCLISLALLVRLSWRNRSFPLRLAVYVLALLCFGTWLVLTALELAPQSLLPSRWSDFDFWSRQYSTTKAFAVEYLSAAQYRPELLTLSLVLRSGAGLPSALLLVLCCRVFPKR